MRKKRRRPVVLLLILLLAVASTAAAWWFYGDIFKNRNSVPTEIGLVSGRPVPAGQKEYYNPTYHFSILYPDTLGVREVDEGAGSFTVTLENLTEGNGFQIFIVPYTQDQVTQERFKQDLPSGVRDNVQEISLAGAKGASFYSVDKDYGDTREVWFIKDGFLYEVTTLKRLDLWLEEVLKTWEFK